MLIKPGNFIKLYFHDLGHASREWEIEFCILNCFSSVWTQECRCTLLIWININNFFCFRIAVSEPSFIAKSEDRLFKHLFEDYQRWVRPVEHLNDTIKIKFGLAISQLVDVVCIVNKLYFFSTNFKRSIISCEIIVPVKHNRLSILNYYLCNKNAL